VMMGVPTYYVRLAAHPGLTREAVAGMRDGVPVRCRFLATPIDEAYANVVLRILERYGMTEVGMALSCGLGFADRVDGSVGWPLPSVEVRLVDLDTGQVVAPGQEKDAATGRLRANEIQLRGPTVFREYWRNAEATAKEFVAADDDDGGGDVGAGGAGGKGRAWFQTGDVAVRRRVGGAGKSAGQPWARGPMYFIQGRKSADIIKTGGEKVSALEVEREMLSLPEISEAAVVAVPSGKWGQKVGAVVVLDREQLPEGKATWTPMDMRRALRPRLVAYKIPQVLRVVDHIPRNAMGKINKRQLVDAVFQDDFSGDEQSNHLRPVKRVRVDELEKQAAVKVVEQVPTEKLVKKLESQPATPTIESGGEKRKREGGNGDVGA